MYCVICSYFRMSWFKAITVLKFNSYFHFELSRMELLLYQNRKGTILPFYRMHEGF